MYKDIYFTSFAFNESYNHVPIPLSKPDMKNLWEMFDDGFFLDVLCEDCSVPDTASHLR